MPRPEQDHPQDAGDPVDRLVAQWARERPELEPDLPAMAIFGRLGRLHLLAGRAIESVFADEGLSTGEFDVLAALRRSGAPFRVPPSQLARTLMLSPAGMTNRVDRLEAAGLVRRRADPDDRRTSAVELTDEGRAVVDRATRAHLDNEVRLLAGLSARDREALDRILRILLAQFDADRG
jgi:DNA-binding MarR family transcriptional regulator